MPLVQPLPPPEYYGQVRKAVPFHHDMLKGWQRRCRNAGHTYWLHRGRLVSQASVAVFGAVEAWERAAKPTMSLDITTTPWTLGPA